MFLGMNFFDVSMVAFIMGTAFLGFYNGLFLDVLRTFVWIITVIFVIFGVNLFLPVVASVFGENLFSTMATFFALFVSVFFATNIVINILYSILTVEMFGPFDRPFGGIMGLIKAFILIMLGYIFILWAFAPSLDGKWAKESRIMPIVEETAIGVASILPEFMVDGIEEFVEKTSRKSPHEKKDSDEMKEMKEKLKELGGKIGDTVEDTIDGDIIESVEETVEETAEAIKETVEETIDDGIEETLDNTAESIKETVEDLGDEVEDLVIQDI
ncbi:MAG: CvpA family protein [Alphaproteobacteria bacterium]